MMKEYLDGDTMAGVTVGDTRLGSCCQLTLCSPGLLMAGENAHTQSSMQGGFLRPISIETKEIS